VRVRNVSVQICQVFVSGSIMPASGSTYTHPLSTNCTHPSPAIYLWKAALNDDDFRTHTNTQTNIDRQTGRLKRPSYSRY